VLRAIGPTHVEVALPFASDQTITAMAIDPPSPGVGSSLFVRAVGVSLFAPNHADGFCAQVLDVAFNGRGYEHVVKLGDDTVLTKIFSHQRFEREGHVKVCFDPSSCLVMDPMKGR